MKIVPIKIKLEVLLNNCHLFSNDVSYNSLIISNAINKNIKLIDIYNYNQLSCDYKNNMFNTFNTFKFYPIFILAKNGVYEIRPYDDLTIKFDEYSIEFTKWGFIRRFMMYDRHDWLMTIVE